MCASFPQKNLHATPGLARCDRRFRGSERVESTYPPESLQSAERSPLLAPRVATVTEDEIVFTTGSAVAAFPCTSRGGRGWPISTLVMDEAAHFLDTEGNSAETVWRALVPSTAQFGKEAKIIVASTPWGQEGLFASLFQQASSGELRDAVAFQVPTAEANPTIDPDFLEGEEARDPEVFRSEYEARFLGGGASFLDPEPSPGSSPRGQRRTTLSVSGRGNPRARRSAAARPACPPRFWRAAGAHRPQPAWTVRSAARPGFRNLWLSPPPPPGRRRAVRPPPRRGRASGGRSGQA